MLLVPHYAILPLESVRAKMELEEDFVNIVMLVTSMIHLLAAQSVTVAWAV